MTPKQRVQEVLNAMNSVKQEASNASRLGETVKYQKLMLDLTALHVCLEGEVRMLILELNKIKPYIIKGGKCE